MGLQEIGFEDVNWFLLAQDEDSWPGFCEWASQKMENFFASQATIPFSETTELHRIVSLYVY
jgi:hypothetical protein